MLLLSSYSEKGLNTSNLLNGMERIGLTSEEGNPFAYQQHFRNLNSQRVSALARNDARGYYLLSCELGLHEKDLEDPYLFRVGFLESSSRPSKAANLENLSKCLLEGDNIHREHASERDMFGPMNLFAFLNEAEQLSLQDSLGYKSQRELLSRYFPDFYGLGGEYEKDFPGWDSSMINILFGHYILIAKKKIPVLEDEGDELDLCAVG